QAAVFPWDFDEQKYLQRQGVCAKFRPVSGGIKVVSVADAQNSQSGIAAMLNETSERLVAWVDNLRGRMVELHRGVLGQEHGDLLSSMVIGDKSVTPSANVRNEFRSLGLSHIIAASGFNL